ncbi:hypothetical protein TGMAS_252880B, partial [Toxoplasma gondii MAS]
PPSKATSASPAEPLGGKTAETPSSAGAQGLASGLAKKFAAAEKPKAKGMFAALRRTLSRSSSPAQKASPPPSPRSAGGSSDEVAKLRAQLEKMREELARALEQKNILSGHEATAGAAGAALGTSGKAKTPAKVGPKKAAPALEASAETATKQIAELKRENEALRQRIAELEAFKPSEPGGEKAAPAATQGPPAQKGAVPPKMGVVPPKMGVVPPKKAARLQPAQTQGDSERSTNLGEAEEVKRLRSEVDRLQLEKERLEAELKQERQELVELKQTVRSPSATLGGSKKVSPVGAAKLKGTPPPKASSPAVPAASHADEEMQTLRSALSEVQKERDELKKRLESLESTEKRDETRKDAPQPEPAGKAGPPKKAGPSKKPPLVGAKKAASPAPPAVDAAVSEAPGAAEASPIAAVDLQDIEALKKEVEALRAQLVASEGAKAALEEKLKMAEAPKSKASPPAKAKLAPPPKNAGGTDAPVGYTGVGDTGEKLRELEVEVKDLRAEKAALLEENAKLKREGSQVVQGQPASEDQGKPVPGKKAGPVGGKVPPKATAKAPASEAPTSGHEATETQRKLEELEVEVKTLRAENEALAKDLAKLKKEREDAPQGEEAKAGGKTAVPKKSPPKPGALPAKKAAAPVAKAEEEQKPGGSVGMDSKLEEKIAALEVENRTLRDELARVKEQVKQSAKATEETPQTAEPSSAGKAAPPFGVVKAKGPPKKALPASATSICATTGEAEQNEAQARLAALEEETRELREKAKHLEAERDTLKWQVDELKQAEAKPRAGGQEREERSEEGDA